MGKVEKFDIALSNTSGVYRPGDTLSGQVILRLDEEASIYGKTTIYCKYCTIEIKYNFM